MFTLKIHLSVATGTCIIQILLFSGINLLEHVYHISPYITFVSVLNTIWYWTKKN